MKESKKENKKPQEKKHNKKFVIILSVVILVAVLIGGGIALSISSFKGDGTTIRTSSGKVKISKSETSSITYEPYDNGLISLNIPKGWKIDIAPFDYIHYTFKLYNPSDSNYMLLFTMKLEGFNKSEAARNWQKKYYPNVMFAKTPVISSKTTEGFYKVWNETAEYVNKNDAKSNFYPKMNSFKVIQNIGKSPIGGDILRATFKDSNSKLVQGLFTASVKDVGSYYVNSNPFNLTSKKIDVWTLNVYNIILMTAPDEEFNNWQGILDKCLSSLQFSDKFVSGFNKEEASILSTIKANQKVYDQISDMIMDSWEKRNNSYDITSQKQSDATLGYERVYDTETGDIYKAYNGFTDDYKGDRYKSITDDMYTSAVSGYIEK